jgi:5'-nucleotidase / UDP-sugar diphosphatase
MLMPREKNMPHVRTLAALVLAAASSAYATPLSFTLFHHSDGESSLTSAPGQANFGGVHRFKTKLDQLRTAAGANTLTLSNGDMFLAGAQFNASQVLPSGSQFYDGIALTAMNYDAMGFGNHEFDFGPAVTKQFVESIGPSYPNTATGPKYLAANLNFAGEPSLAPLAVSGKLAKSTTKVIDGQTVGIVAAVTSLLPSISSPGGVVVNPVLSAVQSEVDALTLGGVKHIVLLSHLQNIEEEIALIPLLKNVDVVVAGGGEEFVSNVGTAVVPGDIRPTTIGGISNLPNQYPLMRTDNNGKPVALVSTAGQYKYIGQLSLSFDSAGEITSATGNPVRVASLAGDGVNGVANDAALTTAVVNPVNAHQAVLDANKLAETQVALEGRRVTASPLVGIRLSETNLGNLVADSLRWAAGLGAANEGLSINSNRLIAMQNSGGIRNNTLIPASAPGVKSFTELTTFQVNAFGNFVSIVRGLTPANIESILEHSVANLIGGGQWGHWSGISFRYNRVTGAGNRIEFAQLADGTVLIDNYLPVAGAPSIDLATINFLVTGGDGFPIQSIIGSFGLTVDTFAISYQEALELFVSDSRTFFGLPALNGLIPASLYAPLPVDDIFAVNAARRIDAIPEPTALAVLVPAGLLLARRKR